MQQRLRTALPLLLIAVIGLGVGISIEQTHLELTANPELVPSCDVSETVKCSVVLSSTYSTLLGVSVSLWAILFYCAIVVVTASTIWTASFARRREVAGILFAMSLSGLVFSFYLAAVAWFELNTVCPLCSALYVVSIALVGACWWFRKQLAPPPGRRESRPSAIDRLALPGGLIAGALIAAIGVWEGWSAPQPLGSAEEIERERPDFYQWYFNHPVADVSTDGGQSLGADDAPITLVEFSDYGCGFCAAFDRTLAQVLRAHRGEVRVVFRHFPLNSDCNPGMEARAHPLSCTAAAAAECAGEQDSFWPYHRLLFEHQSQFRRSELIGYAREINLDIERFQACLDGSAARERVKRDAAEGVRLGIKSTPTLFINGRKIEGALDAQRLADALTLAGSK